MLKTIKMGHERFTTDASDKTIRKAMWRYIKNQRKLGKKLSQIHFTWTVAPTFWTTSSLAAFTKRVPND